MPHYHIYLDITPAPFVFQPDSLNSRTFDRTSFFDQQFVPATVDVHPGLAAAFQAEAVDYKANTARFPTLFPSDSDTRMMTICLLHWLRTPWRGTFWLRGGSRDVGVVVQHVARQTVEVDKRPTLFYFFSNPVSATSPTTSTHDSDSAPRRNSYQALFATLAAQLRAMSSNYRLQTDDLLNKRPDFLETATISEQFEFLFTVPLKSATAQPTPTDGQLDPEQKWKPVIVICGLHLCSEGREIAHLISHTFLRRSSPILFIVTTRNVSRRAPTDNGFFAIERVGVADLHCRNHFPGSGPLPEGEGGYSDLSGEENGGGGDDSDDSD